jgi:hypothetical protein
MDEILQQTLISGRAPVGSNIAEAVQQSVNEFCSKRVSELSSKHNLKLKTIIRNVCNIGVETQFNALSNSRVQFYNLLIIVDVIIISPLFQSKVGQN